MSEIEHSQTVTQWEDYLSSNIEPRQSSASKNVFFSLRKKNVNDKIEKKDGLTYLSWVWAWDAFKCECPNANYEVMKTPAGMPCFESDAGAMVYTRVSADGQTHDMWLPVMDSKNKAMKKTAYTYSTKYGDKTVESYTMFDVNKTIMRCLVKNLAMFGLGLYIYAGEDLPSEDDTPQDKKEPELKREGLKHKPLPNIALTEKRRELIEKVARNAIDLFNSGDQVGAYEEVTSIDNQEELLALWGLLPANLRASIKQQKQDKKNGI